MTQRATFTLEAEAFAFLQAAAGNNRSAYINLLLKAEKQRQLEEALLQANQEEAENATYQEELSAWDEALFDGIDP
jgi:antitoxin CcdA